MLARRILLAVVTAAALLAASPAHAARGGRGSRGSSASSGGSGLSLGVGADYLVDPQSADLQVTLAAETHLARHFTLGGRFGVAWLTEPDRIGVPVDLRLRGRFGRLYVDGLVGPWIVFDDDDALRVHAGVGFGILTPSFSFGIEAGYLDPTSMIGVRLAFPL
jgi:hypothetical protein